ncbi:MAG TPA: class I SAM-dependent methyltransferase [Gemmatimonadales bacterium]|nr:class I SAM-dependent methyltransferase [Gemmatimonadales bacterium]
MSGIEATQGSGFKDHFSQIASAYAAHRPTYPHAIVDYLADQVPRRDVAWDAGCGSGQLSTLLADRFARVIATDPSADQIAQARAHEGVEYRQASAESCGLEAGSVDLAVAAQAAHWFDLPRYYAEVRRVVRPGGLVALLAYGVVHLDRDLNTIVDRFYWQTLAGFWPQERKIVEEGYRSLPFPFPEFQAPAFAMTATWSLAQLLGYVRTWSAVQAIERARGGEAYAGFARALTATWGDPDSRRAVRWDVALRVGRV